MRHIATVLAAATVTLSLAAHADPTTARVRAWVVDPSGRADGLLLSDGTVVRFPAMAGERAAQQIRRGERVSVSDDGQTLLVVRTGWSMDLGMAGFGLGGGPSVRPPVPRSERAIDGMTVSSGQTGSRHYEVRGTIAALTYTRGRQVDGFVLDGGITVRIPPYRAGALSRLRRGDTVRVTGAGMRGPHGIGIAGDTVHDARGRQLVSNNG